MVITDSTKKVLDLIKKAQTERDWSDGEFSRQLGIVQSQWSRIQRGIRPITLEFLRAVAHVFPEIRWQLADYAING